MASIEAAVMLAVFFFIGAVIGVIVMISLAIHREERRHSLGGQAGSNRRALSARRLASIWPRAYPASRRYASGSAAG